MPRRGKVRGHTAQAAGFVIVMGLDLLQMVVFAGLVGAAIWLRRRSDYHKRLMLLTIACLLPDALARLPVSFVTNSLILLGIDGSVLAIVAIDTVRHRRLHPTFGWGAGVVIGSFILALPLLATPACITFASRWLS